MQEKLQPSTNMPASPLSSFGVTIIHQTQEAEEDTWAGEATSGTLFRHCLSIYAPLGTEKNPDRGVVPVHSVCTRGQSKNVCGLLLYAAVTAFFLFFAHYESCRCWLSEMTVIVWPLVDGRLMFGPPHAIERLMECCRFAVQVLLRPSLSNGFQTDDGSTVCSPLRSSPQFWHLVFDSDWTTSHL